MIEALLVALIFFLILWAIARKFETKERDIGALLTILYAVDTFARKINKIYNWCFSRLRKEV